MLFHIQSSLLLGLGLYFVDALAGPLNLDQRAPQCSADNCARAVTGTAPSNPPLATRKADCASFFGTSTVTPQQVTVTQTATVTSPVTQTASTTTTAILTATVTNLAKRANRLEERAGTVPAYASPCSGTVRYSSACSCFGVTQATVTAAAPTSTSIVTVTASPTVSTATTLVVQTTTTVAKTCPTSPVVNGGFESGSISPFNFQSFPAALGGFGSSAVVVNDPALANSGSYLLSVNADVEFAGPNFALTQTLSLCPGSTYKVAFYTASQCPRAGACSCALEACLGGNCGGFDPPGGDAPRSRQEFTFNVPDTAGPTTELKIDLADFGGGIRLCERRFVRFDDFSVTLVQ
ncbi:MAG: hypothetical protein Q9223_005685 [Gallowayella weberi]